MAQKIYPTKTGYIVDKTINIGNRWGHIQGIAQLGDEYTVLSSDYEGQELIVARGAGNRKKVVHVQAVPNEYKHAGGIGALKINNDEWMIVVPVQSKKKQMKDAIFHYFFSKKNGVHNLELRHITELEGAKVGAAGIVQMKNNSVLIAVVIDGAGNQVQFLTCNNVNRIGKYKNLGLWQENQADKSQWIDKNWGNNNGKYLDRGYPDSISLIEHGEKIYFVGMHNNGPEGVGGEDWVDIYSVDFTRNVRKWLVKTHKFHAICTEPPSFRWGGNARIENGRVEILAVERDVQENALQGNVYIRYDKFYLDIDQNSEDLHLTPLEIPTDTIQIT